MLIGDVKLSDKGITIYDVDGSSIELNIHDALDLAQWLVLHKEVLQERERRQQLAQDKAKAKETDQ